MALTKVTGSVIKDSVSLSGNVSVGGTLTYQDVTNVDALGIGTFRTGIKVLAGQVDVGSNIKLGNAGVITATSFVGNGAITINNNADNRVITGSGSANTLEGESALTFSGQTLSVYGAAGDPGRIDIKEGGAVSRIMTTRNSDTNGDLRFFTEVGGSLAVRAKINYSGDFEIPDKIVHEGDTNTAIRFPAADTITFETTGAERLRIDSSGNILLSKGTQNTLMSYTSDGSDNQSIFVGGGGGPSDTRGAYIWAKGNEYTTTGGYLQLNAGNVGTAPITFSTNGSERARIDSSGRAMIGNTTVGNSTTEKLILQGQVGNDNFESSMALRRGTTISTSDAGLGYVKFQDSAGSTGALLGGRADSAWSGSSRPTHLWFATVKSGSTSLTEACRITSGGYLQQHNLPIASYSDTRQISLSSADLTGSNFYNYLWYTSDSNLFDSSTGHFIAPVHGVYRLYFRCSTDATTGNRANVRLRKNGSTRNEAYASNQAGATSIQSVSSEIVDVLNAGEYFDIQVAQLHTQTGTQHKQVTFHMLG